MIIRELFELETLESGHEHPAERYLSELAETMPEIASQAAVQLLREDCFTAAQVLRCLGRVNTPQVQKAFLRIVEESLRSEEIILRDGAVRALEGWGCKRAIRLLEDHEPQERVIWLREYLRRVIQDLKGSSDDTSTKG